jgi:hypothetical protein
MFDYAGMASDATVLIKEFGMRATLRRIKGVPADFSVWVVITEHNPREQRTAAWNPTDRRVIMSISGLNGEIPDNEKHVLVTYIQPDRVVVNETLPLTCSPKRTSPAGIDVIWEFTVRL